MKKLFLTGIGFFLAMSLTFAQQTTPEENATKVVTELVTKLTLNEEQKTAVSTIVLNQEKAIAAVIQDATATADAKKESITKIQGESDTKIAQLLTDEQKTAYQKYVTERPPVSIPATQEKTEQNESGNGQSNQ
ncbi:MULTISPECIES: hypothetical protein [Sphingobacterium]|jgi:polyhydroxyalkanoate synthesis regulator phasin|uniref:Uncharacterized protein n=1 Tax=Sphingobacterium multivorum TaxID=28454 RepID=A0A2X2J783_SPHMU|nr:MULTISPECIES: hypothetical protein [Sphingobacterium]HAE66352.1 hypothetical protein [Sphingobacterium sp.]OFV18497.1 hypothetical protein HMPREF3127_06450 [Sphingobacterium sp. HMSC13C05]OJZ13349.1 MAG: hypothetical protein BGP15_16770 [Sphingobacterium sp. 40-24]QQT43424.1 hypothetical protein I6J00_16920 [Sphingobacterium multivorum]QRQ61011.1 hypothetical protein I6J33_23410 [Sphingobacterium multivorum]